jgi:tripartite-type tricarboxylate transporter receptor subunit TctC
MKKMVAKKMLSIGMAFVAALLMWVSSSSAGDYPDKPIRLIYPLSRGFGG